MKRILPIILVIAMFGCAAQTDLSKTKSSTGLGSSPFSTGGSFTAANANAINNAINDNDSRLDTIEALTGPVFSDGDGTYTDMSAISSIELGYLNGIAGAIYFTGGTDVAVADGGTGAGTAAGARTNLGAAASGANTDITSINGKIQDADGDTYAEPESGADDDTFRIYSGGEAVAEFLGETAASGTYGKLTLKSSAATYGMTINNDSDDKDLFLCGGASTADGSWIGLYGDNDGAFPNMIYFGDSAGGFGSWDRSGLDILSQVRFVGAGTVANIPASGLSAGDIYIATDGDTKCDTTTGGGVVDPYIIRYDGASWECIGDGTISGFSVDDAVEDTVDNDLLDTAALSHLTEDDAISSAPGSPVAGKVYKADCVKWDPNALSVDVSGTGIAWVSGTPATITDTGSGFGSVEVGMLVYSSTSTNNTSVYHVASVVAGTVTLASGESVTSEGAGESETVVFGYVYESLYGADGNYYAIWDAGGNRYHNELQLPGHATNDAVLDALGKVFVDDTESALAIHMGANGEIAGEVQISAIQHISISFDPKVVCDGTIDRLFLMTVGDEAPNGIIIDEWSLSFEADPTTEFGAGETLLKYADAFIGVANSATIDDLATTAGVASEDTDSNINSGSAVANTKVIYIDFPTAYTETGHQCIFEMRYHLEED